MSAIDETGFLIVERALPRPDVETLAAHLADAPLPRTRAGARNLLADAAVATMARSERLVRVASDVVGAGAFPFRATLFDKSQAANWLVAWHQDTALPLRERHDAPGWGPWSIKAGVLHAHAPAEVLAEIVAIRIHLDDSTRANGPLRVLPGTHRLGVLGHSRIEDLAGDVPPVECVVGRGGLVVMRPLLVHASSKATSPLLRRVLHVEYAVSRDLGHRLELRVAGLSGTG